MSSVSSLRAIAAATAFAVLLAACDATTAVVPVPPIVSASPPIQQDVAAWDTFTGRFEAVDSVEIRPRVGGYVEQVAFHDGDIVRKGALLFVIDPRPYEAAVLQAEGQLAQARSQLELTNKELGRARSLVTTQAISTSVLDQRLQAQQGAASAVTTATGALTRAQLDLEFTKVLAPLTGRISRKLVSEGNLVAGGDANATLLTTIVSLDPIDVYFDIDEESYLRYRRLFEQGKRTSAANVGSEVRIALPGEDTASRTGELDFVENRLDSSTGTLRARARMANHNHGLTPGQFARVSVIAEAPHPALLIPDVAVTNDATQQVLLVVGPDDRVVEKPVILGRLFGKLREIVQGLSAADRVIVSGIQRVQPGIRVTVQSQTTDVKQLASAGETL